MGPHAVAVFSPHQFETAASTEYIRHPSAPLRRMGNHRPGGGLTRAGPASYTTYKHAVCQGRGQKPDHCGQQSGLNGEVFFLLLPFLPLSNRCERLPPTARYSQARAGDS